MQLVDPPMSLSTSKKSTCQGQGHQPASTACHVPREKTMSDACSKALDHPSTETTMMYKQQLATNGQSCAALTNDDTYHRPAAFCAELLHYHYALTPTPVMAKRPGNIVTTPCGY